MLGHPLSLFVLLGLGACTASSGRPDDAAVVEVRETGDSLDVPDDTASGTDDTGGTDTSPAADPVEATVYADSVIPTLIHVDWTSSAGLQGRVRWTVEDGLVGTTDLDALSTEHAHAFLGAYAGARVTVEIVQINPVGAEVPVASEVIVLAAAPAALPVIAVDVAPDATPTPYLHVATQDLSTGTVAIQVVDWQGRPVWWLPEGTSSDGFVRSTVDERGMLHTLGDPYDGGLLIRSAWDGTTTTQSAPGIHHEIHQRADGAVGVCRSETRSVDGAPVVADTLTVMYPNGTSRDLWSGFDTVDLTSSNACDGLVLMGGASDGTHSNGIAFDEDEETWLVSLYCQSSVVAIEDSTGDVLWTLGGDESTLTQGVGATFKPQHAPRAVPGGLLLFDNGTRGASRVVEIGVDAGAGTATMRQEWEAPDGGYTPVVGEGNLYGAGLLMAVGTDQDIYWITGNDEVSGALHVVGDAMLISAAPVTALKL